MTTNQVKTGKDPVSAAANNDAENDTSPPSLIRRLYVHLALVELYDYVFIAGLVVLESLLGFIIIRKVAYTEIDWKAYMQEVEAWWVHGELDYLKIRGDTGPLVYPAGFLYLFVFLRRVTKLDLIPVEPDEGNEKRDLLALSGDDEEGGGSNFSATVELMEHAIPPVTPTNLLTAQYIFLGFYVMTQFFVFLLYQTRLSSLRSNSENQKQNVYSRTMQVANDIWFWRIFAMGCLCLSKRLHSIYLLRLFNDGPTMLLLYMSLYLFTKNYWNTGCVVFSLAVSLKMNVLLFAPGLLLLLLMRQDSFLDTILVKLGLCCAGPQLLLGAPFLSAYPISYLRKAFELDRVFFYKWTVNWKFLPEQIFLSKRLSLLLLSLHLLMLALAAVRWLKKAKKETVHMVAVTSNLHNTQAPGKNSSSGQQQQLNRQRLSPHYIIYTLFLSNFIGICFARTLHYQFYCWYFHSIPYLLWSTPALPSSSSGAISSYLPVLVLGLLVLAGIEGAFLTFPATPVSSAVLQICHQIVLCKSLLFLSKPPPLFDADDDGQANTSLSGNKDKGI